MPTAISVPPLNVPLMPTTAVATQQQQRRRRVVEVHGALASWLRIPLESASTSTLRPSPRAARGVRPGPDATVGGAGDGVVEVQGTGPERLVAERVEAKGLTPLVDRLQRVDLGLFRMAGDRLDRVVFLRDDGLSVRTGHEPWSKDGDDDGQERCGDMEAAGHDGDLP
jgi:hypothetical protein